MTILVTGATGFVGKAVVERLTRERRALRAASRRGQDLAPGIDTAAIDDIGRETDWRDALRGVSAVVHLAARVHVMRDRAPDPLMSFRAVNVDGTLNLARQAAAAGASRFVYLSSIKVNGENGVFRESDPPAPADPYAVSKHEAELGLREIAVATGLEVVVIRPPLVYGPEVRANFATLMRAVAWGVPLPFGAVDNRRSLVGLQNLVDLICECLQQQTAADETFLVSDGDDLSTAELIRRIARAMDRPARLVAVPPVILTAAAALVGKRDIARRLLGTLQVDISKARRLLGWQPPATVDSEIRAAVNCWRGP